MKLAPSGFELKAFIFPVRSPAIPPQPGQIEFASDCPTHLLLRKRWTGYNNFLFRLNYVPLKYIHIISGIVNRIRRLFGKSMICDQLFFPSTFRFINRRFLTSSINSVVNLNHMPLHSFIPPSHLSLYSYYLPPIMQGLRARGTLLVSCLAISSSH